MSLRHVRIALAVALVAGAGWLPSARGDVFILSQGGRVVGELQNPNQSPRETYVVKAAEGVSVTLARSQVRQWLRPKPEEIEYQQVRSRYPDTPEGQWELSEWCKERKLLAQRKVHLQRAIELDPDHERAHRALGHIKVDGQWTTQREVMEKQGYRLFGGRWLTPQEIEVVKEKQKLNVAEKEWMQKIGRWIAWLGTDKDDEARKNLLAIQEPAAIKGLATGLKNHANPQVRLLLAQTLARFDSNEALWSLATSAIDDEVEEVRLSCIEFLKKKNNPAVVEYFVGRLRDRKDNVTVNRAAVALRILGDPSAIGPLIDALVTVHKFKLPGGNPGQMSGTFGTGPKGGGMPGGLAVGGGPRIVSQPVANREVLDALVALTGQGGLGFDVRAWRAWHAAQKKQAPTDIRRDP